MVTFGFFTTSTPYILFVLGYLFYFVTAAVDQDLADKWFSIIAPTEICSDDHRVKLEDCIDYNNIAYEKAEQPVYISTFAPIPIAPIGKPHAAYLAIALATPSLSRPPNV